MRNLLVIALVTAAFASDATAQKPKSRPTPRSTKLAVDKGSISGRTYTNKTFGFEITFPDAWLIASDDFEAKMRKRGVDLGLKAPESLTPSTKAQVNRTLQSVAILLTAYRSARGMSDNAIVRISVEGLKLNPQVKDAVDYFDAVRAGFATMRLPMDFHYSETQAEKLGSQQFGFLDVDSKGAKKRMYATVRNGYAVMFTISYAKDEDLRTFRNVLATGDFSLR